MSVLAAQNLIHEVQFGSVGGVREGGAEGGGWGGIELA